MTKTAAKAFCLLCTETVQLVLHALDGSVVAAKHPSKKAARRNDEDELDHHWDHAHVWDEEVEGPEDAPASEDVACPRCQKCRSHNNVDLLALVTFQKGCHLKDAPEPFHVGRVPKHQEGARLLHNRSDVQDPLHLQTSVMLMYADLVQENSLLRSPEEYSQSTQPNPHQKRVGRKLIGGAITQKGMLPVKPGNDAGYLQDHHRKRTQSAHQNSRWPVLEQKEQENFSTSFTMPTVRPEFVNLRHLVAQVIIAFRAWHPLLTEDLPTALQSTESLRSPENLRARDLHGRDDMHNVHGGDVNHGFQLQ
mmetsp:Transcript_23450/g.55343  ORF Transcript_23450/g.55343 Transcript_23450/m.55343 type:complete len:307 (-) Transcript_23450:25-945(-)